jgi:hypothetical protein
MKPIRFIAFTMLAMLPLALSAQAGDGARLSLLVLHDDAVREWAYDRQSAIGRLDKGLDEARVKGWTVVDMKNDWKRIFAWEQ